MYQKLIAVAAGHIIQLHSNVYQSLAYLFLSPSWRPFTENDSVKLLAMKNPEIRTGTKRSWSITTKVPTLINLEVASENIFEDITGMTLLCQKCNIGAV